MDPAELDRLLDRELTALPRPRAPRTLLPRVMAAAATPAAPAATGWFTWPRAWQAAGAGAALAFAALVGWLTLSPPAGVTEATRGAGEAFAIVRVLWDVVVQPAASYLFVIGILFTLACAAAWAALEAALGGASQR